MKLDKYGNIITAVWIDECIWYVSSTILLFGLPLFQFQKRTIFAQKEYMGT
jgi:hypothetical protein